MNILNKEIINCTKCSRLVNFREKIAFEKRKQFSNETYWGKPVPGFGDLKAEILILGLAPAAHGGNRTGRLFTGDKSASFLFKCLFKAKLANQPFSNYSDDGLILNKIYITAALKCVPPQDKPKSVELKNCFNFLKGEFNHLQNVTTILTLGKIAFDSCLMFFKMDKKNHKFKHGQIFEVDKKRKIVASYHPSPRNVNTKRIDENTMVDLLRKVKKMHQK
jgi:uracil-DNA glycosylase family 4|tara:strand:- start:9095 stop:9754 length:660 start_codon:yes stop_codon:yes gene_type:complete